MLNRLTDKLWDLCEPEKTLFIRILHQNSFDIAEKKFSEIEHCPTTMYLCGWILKKANGDSLSTVEKDNFVLDPDDIPNPP